MTKNMKFTVSSFAAVVLALFLGINTLLGASPEGLRFHYDRGVALYESGKYAAAKREFSRAVQYITIDDGDDAIRTRYYAALCTARLGESDARELLDKFLFEYPKSIYANDVHFALACALYESGELRAAYDEFRSVDVYQLNYSEQDEYYFKTGYSAYMSGDEAAAYAYFRNNRQGSKYYPYATYYISYIEYTRGNLAAAKQGFVSIADNPAYAEIIPFYLLQIEFREGNYGYVVDNGPALFGKAAQSRKVEIARILSEAYFHIKDYESTLTYITLYDNLGGAMGREELYLAGYSNYVVGETTRAIDQLIAVAGPDDELSQNAYFHLGGAYLRKNEKRSALSAFSLASAYRYNTAVREESMFNYGKLQYELGGGAFGDAITTLNNFMSEFPQSAYIDEARQYLLAAYFNSRNYEAAYEAIMQVRNPDNDIRTALQKVTYFRALEYYEAGDYARATEFFNISNANAYNAKYTALTKYWQAQVYIKQEKYREAIPLLESYVLLSPRTETEHQMANYDLGYCYFNLQNWNRASSWFGKFMSLYTKNDRIRADAYNRLGDIAMADRQYSGAIGNYDNAILIGTEAADYAQYQRAVMLGLTDQPTRKIDALQAIISRGQGEYVDDAMFELGRTYVQRDRFTDGATTLRSLIDRFPSSPYHVSALSELGLIYQNLGNDAEALRYYKMVVEQYPSSPQAKDAMIGIRNIYVDRNDIDSYFAFARASGVETDMTVVGRDSLSFAAADRVYQSGDYARALTLMTNYLDQYERGAYRADALYAVGDCSLRAGDRAGALAAFREVGAMPYSRYRTSALRSAAGIEFDEGLFHDAAGTYRKMAETSMQTAMTREALAGYLRAAVASGDSDLMGMAADEVLASNAADSELKTSASFAKARALQASGDEAEALRYYRLVAENPRTRDGAEAKYHVIAILFSQGKAKEAENEVFSFSSSSTTHQYWMGRAFLVLGDIYAGQDDDFQARATYRSIVDGYADKTDGIIDEAKAKIEALK